VPALDLEQLFVARVGGRIELRSMLLDSVGRRTRPVHVAPTADERDAVAWFGRVLARDASVRSVRKVRLRVARADALVDDPGLAAALRSAFAAERARLAPTA
jgi:hypothetical protein